MEAFAKLIEAVAKLIGAIAPWTVVGLAIWWLRRSLAGLLDNIAEFKFKGLGIEASGKKIVEVAVPLALAQLRHEGAEAYNDLIKTRLERSLSVSFTTAEQLTSQLAKGVYGRRLLWVDDNPENNTLERQSFEALGLTVNTAKSTEVALTKLSIQDFDLIISDMSRPEGDRAGYDLLEKMKARGHAVPLIFYTTASSPELSKAAVERGAYGQTNRPDDLVHLVVAALHR